MIRSVVLIQLLGVCLGDFVQSSHKSVHDELALLPKVTSEQTYSGTWYTNKQHMRCARFHEQSFFSSLLFLCRLHLAFSGSQACAVRTHCNVDADCKPLNINNDALAEEFREDPSMYATQPGAIWCRSGRCEVNTEVLCADDALCNNVATNSFVTDETMGLYWCDIAPGSSTGECAFTPAPAPTPW
jgi:hypothetical protein